MNKEENQHNTDLTYEVDTNDDIRLYNGDCLKVMDALITNGVVVDSIILNSPQYYDIIC